MVQKGDHTLPQTVKKVSCGGGSFEFENAVFIHTAVAVSVEYTEQRPTK